MCNVRIEESRVRVERVIFTLANAVTIRKTAIGCGDQGGVIARRTHHHHQSRVWMPFSHQNHSYCSHTRAHMDFLAQ